MSTQIQGLSVQGITHSGRKDFSSFPGLFWWIDPRVNVTQWPGSSRVKTFQERGPWGFSWTEQAGSAGITKTTRTDPINPHHVFSVPATNQNGFEYVASPNIDKANFLINGSPWSYYQIFNLAVGSGGASHATFFIRGRWLVYIHPQSTKRFVRIQIADDSNIQRLNLQTANGVFSVNTWNLLEIKHRGYLASGNDVEIYINDVLIDSGNWSGAPGTTATNMVLYDSVGQLTYMGLSLIYDHTGKTETQIDNERAEIRALINELYSI